MERGEFLPVIKARTASSSRGAYLLLFMLGLLTILGMATLLPAPGYMDADYSYATGLQLASGKGFVEPFLWNFLDDPAGLPHPSHLYWMPLAALLAAAGLRVGTLLSGDAQSFFAARSGFLLLAACLPPLTAWLASSFGANRRQAWLAGFLALFPGFYLPFLTTTDTFGIYMLVGALFLQASRWTLSCATSRDYRAARLVARCWLVGILSGLMHLARADGAIWVLVGLATAWMAASRSPGWKGRPGFLGWMRLLSSLGSVLAGYLLVLSPWLLRNFRLAGSLSAPGATRALWITRYDELFAYPAALLTPGRWWSTGLDEILSTRLWALGQNLQTSLAVQGEIFLAPLVLAALWRFRKDPRVRLGVFAWGLTFLAMTLVFPFQGARGGWFHSGAALQPLFWAVAPAGLEALVEWGEKRRGWPPLPARNFLGAGTVGLALFVTLLTALPKVQGAGPGELAWRDSGRRYALLESSLKTAGAPAGASVLVNNPPGYFSATGRPALVIPDGDVSTLLAVARHYDSAYLVLEPNHPSALESLYLHPGDRPGLDYLLTVGSAHIFYLPGD
jgi:hypothetical protein